MVFRAVSVSESRLARAMLRDPAILILDEATSAVDIQDEAADSQSDRGVRQNTHDLPDLPQPGLDPGRGPHRAAGRRKDRGDRNRLRAQAELGPLSPAPRDPLPPRNGLKPRLDRVRHAGTEAH